MTRSLPVEPRGSEDFWAAYWLRQSTQQATATNRLYVQRSGIFRLICRKLVFVAVNRVMPRVGSIQMKLSDCFQVAIADVPKLVAAFDTSKPTGFKAYANTVFGNCLRDYLRQRREIDFCSEWGLLQKISRKRLLDALIASNFDEVMRDRYFSGLEGFNDSS